MKVTRILALIASALILSSCAAFDAAEYEPSNALFPSASAVVGERTVIGLEWPLTKWGVGVGVWTVRRHTETEILAEEREILRDAAGK